MPDDLPPSYSELDQHAGYPSQSSSSQQSASYHPPPGLSAAEQSTPYPHEKQQAPGYGGGSSSLDGLSLPSGLPPTSANSANVGSSSASTDQKHGSYGYGQQSLNQTNSYQSVGSSQSQHSSSGSVPPVGPSSSPLDALSAGDQAAVSEALKIMRANYSQPVRCNLQYTLVIPQMGPEMPFATAFFPAIEQSINQHQFADFIASCNVIDSPKGVLSAVDAAGNMIGMLPTGLLKGVGQITRSLAQSGSGYLTKKRIHVFLNTINQEFFNPRGLKVSMCLNTLELMDELHFPPDLRQRMHTNTDRGDQLNQCKELISRYSSQLVYFENAEKGKGFLNQVNNYANEKKAQKWERSYGEYQKTGWLKKKTLVHPLTYPIMPKNRYRDAGEEYSAYSKLKWLVIEAL